MKKIFIFIVLLLAGCGTDLSNTPTKQAEEFLKKYQTLDNDVLVDLNKATLESENFNTNQRKKYLDIMKKQYGNLTYTVKDETIDGNNAVVEVEIIVMDYKKIMTDTQLYYEQHSNEITSLIDYQLEELDKAKDKVKYTLQLRFVKENDKWKISNVNDTILNKINGIY